MHYWLFLLLLLLPWPAWSQVPDLTTGLELHLKFDEGAPATVAQDSTVHNHDGTLGVGATWGVGKLGPSALSVPGTATGLVTVPGELTQPTAVTLAAWVRPTAFPDLDADVISIGAQVMIRVGVTFTQGIFYSTGGFVVLSVTQAVGTTAWRHVAYTVQAGAQRLYLDGVLIGSGSNGLVPYYAVRGTNTVIGGTGEGSGTVRFQGRIDDVRVYTRVLSATDIAALAALEDPETLAVQVTAPTADATLTTETPVLSTLGGTASDGVGVTGVSLACTTCSPPTATATCTPACGPTQTSTAWTAPSLTLATPGVHELIVTALDASGTSRSDTLTVTYTPPVVPPSTSCTHWASPTGGGNGLAPGSPFQIVHFWALATPGTVLCLLPGTYTGPNGVIHPPTGKAGTSEAPITIQAVSATEEGNVHLDGQFLYNPVALGATNTWFVITGLNARNAVNVNYWFSGANNRGRRLVGWNATSGQSNATVFTIIGANSIIEDCAGFGQNVRTIFQGSGTTSSPGSGFRRCWGEWQDHPTGGTLGGACAQPGTGQFLENLVCSVNKTGD